MSEPTFTDLMERDRQKQLADLAVEQERTKQVKVERSRETRQILAMCFGGLLAACAIVGLAFVIWLGSRGPSAKDQLLYKERTQCVSMGGTWIPNSTDSSDSICVAPGSHVIDK